MSRFPSIDLNHLADNIKAWGKSLGFQQVGISDIDLNKHEQYLSEWLAAGFHGDMHYMASHGTKRARPAELVPGTLRIISVRMDYLPPDASFATHLSDPNIAYVSRYAVGRDYHKVLRQRLKRLGEMITAEVGSAEWRPFVDSAPVLEHAIAEKAGIGWTGKHSLTINREAGSWFFLGELFINLPLPVDVQAQEGCGSCNACLTICPTQAIVAPYKVDARRCISYLTIEYDGIIAEELRSKMGNRIYGCDDCQLVCPWNRFAEVTAEPDFHARESLFGQPLLRLFSWTEKTFLDNTEGSAIRRIGYRKWIRNISIALGNAPFSAETLAVLQQSEWRTDDMIGPHIEWAILQQQNKNKRVPVPKRLTERLIRTVQKGLPRDA